MAAQLVTALYVSGYPQAPSGSVRFYQVGTTTPVNVFSNDGATQVITQPVQLDANGKPTSPIYATVPMRAIIYDSTGAQLLDIERIDGNRAETEILSNTSWPNEATVQAAFTSLATSLGGTDGQVKVSGTGAVQRSAQSKFTERISVKDFGAKGDGIADDSSAFTSAIIYASIAGAEILVPAGNYLVSPPFTVSANGVSFKGAGSLSSIITNTTTTQNVFNISGSRFYFEDIGIAASSTSTGIAINNSQTLANGFARFSGVRITGHRTGITLSGSGNVITGGEIVTDGNAASVCVNFSNNGGTGNRIQLANLDAGSAAGGSGISISGNAARLGTMILGNYFVGGSSGVLMSTTATSTFGISLAANTFSSALGKSWILQDNSASTWQFSEVGNIDLSGSPLTYTDTSNGQGNFYSCQTYGFRPAGASGYSANNISTTSTFTPRLDYGDYNWANATAAGITVTLGAPTTPNNIGMRGRRFYVTCSNTSGGAVTWTPAAIYRTSAAINPGTGTAITVEFAYNNDLTKWIEINRSAAV